MPAFQNGRGVQTVHEKFQTDRAVHSQRLCHALMCTQHRKRQTRNTLVAVEVILSATHAADATAVTVELAFGSIIIEEAAGAAEVGDGMALLEIAYDLGIKVNIYPEKEVEWLSRKILSLQEDVSEMKNTAEWIWSHSDGSERERVEKMVMDQLGFKIKSNSPDTNDE